MLSLYKTQWNETRVAWELTSESLHESFINSHVLVKREQELHESWQARVCMRVSSTFMSWSNENKSCMRVDKREFAWEFHQLSCPGQTRTRVAWELTSESLHETFINCYILREKKWRKKNKISKLTFLFVLWHCVVKANSVSGYRFVDGQCRFTCGRRGNL